MMKALQADGTLDSEGRFTVSLSQARRKMLDFQTTDDSRYLLSIIAAGVSSGAATVEISRQADTLVVRMPGAYLSESSLLEAFDKLFSRGRRPAATELLLGLQMTRSLGSERYDILCRHPERPGFEWSLTLDSDSSHEQPEGPALLEVRIAFQRRNWFHLLSGRSTPNRTDELRWVTERCCFSPVPISLEGVAVNRPLHLSGAPVILERDPPTEVVAGEASVVVQEVSGWWSGALGIQPGLVHLVVNGVLYRGPRDLLMTGVVVCNDLTLDLSRENVVEDRVYTKLCQDLIEARNEALLWAPLETLPQEWCQMAAPHLIEPALQGRLSEPRLELLADLLDVAPPENGASRLSELKLLYKVARLYEKMNSPKLEETAHKGYERARSLFAEYGLQLDLVDMCAWLGSRYRYRHMAAEDWRMLGAALALNKRLPCADARLQRVASKSLNPECQITAQAGLWALASFRGERETARRHRKAVELRLEDLQDMHKRAQLREVLAGDPLLACCQLHNDLMHYASYSREVNRAIKDALR